MIVTVVGKERIAGTSRKTGKAFDSVVAHCVYPKNGVDGMSVDSLWLAPETYPLESIAVGGDYSVDRDSRGFLISFTPVKK